MLRWRCKKNEPDEPEDHALGRSRGGFGTKLSILCNKAGVPLHFYLAAGQCHDSSVLDSILEEADERLVYENGEPVAWPINLAGDKGYRAEWIDNYLLNLGITPVIPCKKNEDRSKRSVDFSKALYKKRSIVECLIGWLKECRRIATRYEKSAINFGAMVKMTFIQRYLRVLTT